MHTPSSVDDTLQQCDGRVRQTGEQSVGLTPLEFGRDLWRQKTRTPELSYSVISVILRLAIWCNTGLCGRLAERHVLR